MRRVSQRPNKHSFKASERGWLGSGTRPLRLLGGTIAAVAVLAAGSPAHAQCVCGYGDGRFTIDQNIVIDGSMGDWTPILADPDNNVCDGGAGSIPPQPDRDAPVQSTGRDLIHFAYTWDNSGVHTYTGRAASSKNVQRFIYYADTDNDGLMETGEPVIVAQWKGNNRDVRLYLGSYVAASPGGDSMVDGLGYADGFSLPGLAVGFPSVGSPDYQGSWGSSSGLVMEWGVPWSVLGVPPGTAFTFHVSSTNSQPGSGSFPAQVDDNMAGCGGGPGSTQFADLAFFPDRNLAGGPGSTVTAAHSLTNLGNGGDTFNLSQTISGDHAPAVEYYRDTDGGGDLTPGDVLLTDTDGDGTPDSGPLASGATIEILAAYTIAAGAAGNATCKISATSSFDPNVWRLVTDTISVMPFPDIVMVKSVQTASDPINGAVNPKAIPGAAVLYSLLVSNQGLGEAENNSIAIVDPVPAETGLFVGDIDGPGSGPVKFEQGPVASGLSYSFISLDSAIDDLDFSANGGATYDYTPIAGADGCDAAVTHIRITPTGAFNASDGVNHPSFNLIFRTLIE